MGIWWVERLHGPTTLFVKICSFVTVLRMTLTIFAFIAY